MQLYALDKDDKFTFAQNATKHLDYTCVECQDVVRVRKGQHRQPHFYHLNPQRECRQNGKSMVHLMLQYHLKAILPADEAQLECRFNAINRIADVVWHPQKLIYEIQCSPISADEILARNRDYHSLGFKVIWIFHDARYNQFRKTAAEDSLADAAHYYTNMDAEGRGMIYDEFRVRLNAGVLRLPKFSINLACPQKYLEEHDNQKLPKHLKLRRQKWEMGFAGDSIDVCNAIDYTKEPKDGTEEHLREMIEKLFNEHEYDIFSASIGVGLKTIVNRWLVRSYKAIFRLFLERACR